MSRADPLGLRGMQTVFYGLTVHAIWAWCIANGYKRIENRSWRPPPKFLPPLQGGSPCVEDQHWLAIHAGNRFQVDEVRAVVNQLVHDGLVPNPGPSMEALYAQCGKIVAVACVSKVVTNDPSPWFLGPFGWVLDRIKLPDPVPCSGRQRLWRLPADVEQNVRMQFAAASHGALLWRAPRISP